MSELMRVQDALSYLERKAECVTGVVTLPLGMAFGRILSEDQFADINVPPADNSAMDGFAVSLQGIDIAKAIPVSQRIAAGQVPEALQAGTAARIFTGAEIPKGADVVIIQEECCFRERNRSVSLINPESIQVGDNIRLCGENISKGQLLFSKSNFAKGSRTWCIGFGRCF